MKFQPKYVDSLCGKTCHILLSKERLQLILRGRLCTSQDALGHYDFGFLSSGLTQVLRDLQFPLCIRRGIGEKDGEMGISII